MKKALKQAYIFVLNFDTREKSMLVRFFIFINILLYKFLYKTLKNVNI